MMNTTQFKELAQLAQASYAFIESSAYRNKDATKVALIASKNSPFTEIEADQFTQRYEVLDQFSNSSIFSDGFSATVFRDKDNPNRLILSCRGTEFSGDKIRDIAITDLRIGDLGYAAPQAATKGVSIALFSQPKTHIKKCPVIHALS